MHQCNDVALFGSKNKKSQYEKIQRVEENKKSQRGRKNRRKDEINPVVRGNRDKCLLSYNL